VCLAILIPHSLLAHKEFRFIAFVALSVPVFIGLGSATLSEALLRRAGRLASMSFAALTTAGVAIASWYGWSSGYPVEYMPNQGVLRVFIAAHDERQLCGLGIADYIWSVTGGYTYLNRSVPIYYSESLFSTARPNYYGWGPRAAGQPLAIHVVLHDKTLPQFPGASLFANKNAYNYLVAIKGHGISRYAPVKCFSNSGARDACLLRREGSCVSTGYPNERS
jgi:hypothetical protein